MRRLPRLLRRAWVLRHDREAMIRGLDKVGIRAIPGVGDYAIRSPRVGRLIHDAWAGHETRSIAELRDLSARSGREAIDATVALAVWDLSHQRLTDAIARLRSRRRLPRDGRRLLHEALRSDLESWLDELNRRLDRAGFSTVSSDSIIRGGRLAPVTSVQDGPTVSVVVPARGTAQAIAYTVDSLLAQTWRNIQILVVGDEGVDDHGVDGVFDDPRVLFVSCEDAEGGMACNRGLRDAEGDFTTVVEVGSWVHPQRIETQVRNLQSHASVIANSTSCLRITKDFVVAHLGNRKREFAHPHPATLMLKTSLLREIGGWDEVRFGADEELEARLASVFGPLAVTRLHGSIPLTLVNVVADDPDDSSRIELASANASSGARNIYSQAFANWHRTLTSTDLRIRRNDDFSPFPCPSLIRRTPSDNEHLDVVILSDLGLPGGTTSSNLAEIAASTRTGWQTGLVHNRNPRLRDSGINPKYFDASSNGLRFLCAGERISCDVLVIKYPPSALQIPDVFPRIEVRHEVVVAANQTPFTGYTGDRLEVYSVDAVNEEVESNFGRVPLWSPIGPSVRRVFDRYHAEELAGIRWSDHDWFEVIDAEIWRRRSRPDHREVFRIGRHGRDSRWKWPSDPLVFDAVYPREKPYVIDILGGAEDAARILGRLPANWHVRPFDSIPPADFLAQLDVFVHFAHPDMEEGFGRTILEALATGVPVITEPRFASPFGDAVIASHPSDVRSHLERLRSDQNFYDDMVQRGFALVASRFDFTSHVRRIEALRSRSR